jgi:hypothetical protein
MHTPPRKTRLMKLPLRQVEERFGPGNFDDAGDALVAFLNGIMEGHHYSIAWSFDTLHPNPWYHSFDLTIKGLSDDEAQTLEYELDRMGIPST